MQQIANRFFLIHAGKLREIASVEPYFTLLARREQQKRAAKKNGAKHTSSPSAEHTLDRQPDESVEQAILRLEAVLAAGKVDRKKLQRLARRITQLYDQL